MTRFGQMISGHQRRLMLLVLVMATGLWACRYLKIWTLEILHRFPPVLYHGCVYDVEEISQWYKGSVCSSLRGIFVGAQPLFPPCRPDQPHGIPTWGAFPYEGPFDYSQQSKNPCWWQNKTLLCSPYFYLIGVSKSGTTDLYERITRHPDVVSSNKEPHWFDRNRYAISIGREPVSLMKYLSTYGTLAKNVAKDIARQGKSKKISGDASPSYFYDNDQWRLYSGNEGCTEPRVILANHIRHLYPNVKIILIIRHPINRLYARYLFDYGSGTLMVRDPPSPQKFHDYVTDGLQKYRDCFQRWSLRHCVYNASLNKMVHDLRIQESLYPVLLEDWLRVIPRDQILFIRFEDYSKNATSELVRVYQHLGLELPDGKTLQKIALQQIANRGQMRKIVGPMLAPTQRLLEDFYQPFNRRLAAMLQQDKFLWKELHPPGHRTASKGLKLAGALYQMHPKVSSRMPMWYSIFKQIS